MPIPGDNLAARLLETALARQWGDRVALREGARTWTYAELADRVQRVAAVLRSLGIDRGERVAVLMPDSLDAAAAILGSIHAGAVAVPLSELARSTDVRAYLMHCDAAAAIVHEALVPALDAVRGEVTGLREVLCVGGAPPTGIHDYHRLLEEAVPTREAAAVAPHDPAVMVYSTADVEQELRGVPHAHATPMLAFASFAQGILGLEESDRVFCMIRLSTTYGLGTGLIFPLAAGAQTLLLAEKPRSETVLAAIASFDPTVILAAPSLYGQLARDAEAAEPSDPASRPLARCRACVSGTEAMPPRLLDKARDVLGADVIVGYGLTEAFQFVLVGSADVARQGACGRPVSGFDVRIVDEEGQPVGPNVIGTLQVRGPTLLGTYWGAKEPDRLDDGWFTTRDRFMRDEHGSHYHFGRLDDIFKVGGKWVSPAEMERVLGAHEAVWECAVIGAEDQDGLTKPMAFVVPNIGHTADAELARALRDHLKNELAPYKYPRWIEFVDKLPRGPHGKILRYKLQARGKRRTQTKPQNASPSPSPSPTPDAASPAETPAQTPPETPSE